MRSQVAELAALGPFPHELDATDGDVSIREELLGQIVPPVAEDEARTLLPLFGEDDFWGLAWSLVHLIEAAPGWPYWDAIEDESNRWHVLLMKRSINAGDRPPEKAS